MLIDEVDGVVEREKAINALFVGTPAEIYVTASSEMFIEKIFIQVLPPDGTISVRRITRPLRALLSDAEKLLIMLNPEKNFGDVKNITLHDFLLNV